MACTTYQEDGQTKDWLDWRIPKFQVSLARTVTYGIPRRWDSIHFRAFEYIYTLVIFFGPDQSFGWQEVCY